MAKHPAKKSAKKTAPANTKSRLGRGLSGLIAGGGPAASSTPTQPAQPTKPAKPTAAKKSAKPTAKTSATQASANNHGKFREVSPADIALSPYQARKKFDSAALEELAASIRSEGLLQPLNVREIAPGNFELIAGERRLRACTQLGMQRIPVHVVEASDSSSAVLGLIENLQRQNLNAIEAAQGYLRLMEEFKLSQEAVAKRVGKARSSVTNMLRLLQLPSAVQTHVAEARLSFGHARALMGLENEKEQLHLAEKIIKQNLSVRATETAVAATRASTSSGHTLAPMATSAILGSGGAGAQARALSAVEEKLATKLGTPVAIKHGRKKGSVTITYYGEEGLQGVLESLGVKG